MCIRDRLWLEDGTNNFLRIWDGSSFIKIGAAFADVAGTATVSIASGAIVANSALVASGAFGAVSASGALGTPIASGALLASGALGTPIASGLEVLTISGAFPTVPASGVFGYRVDPPSGLYLSFGGGWVPVS